ncbi:MAG: alginate O-acetyltransferase AlgX-related protein [Acidobacteriota bacterium]
MKSAHFIFWLRRLARLGLFLALIIAARNWLVVSTQRLFLEDRTDYSRSVGVPRQQFDIESGWVVPRIVAPETSSFRFHIGSDHRSRLEVEILPALQASYQVDFIDGSIPRRLASASVRSPQYVSLELPRRPGVLEFSSHGALVWSDIRITSEFDLVPHLLAVAVLLLVSFLPARGAGTNPLHTRQQRLRWMGFATVGGAVLIAVLLTEATLQLLGARLPSSIVAERRLLGMASPDPRWEASRRYGMRLRPNLDTFCQWRYGDIAQMGFIPNDVTVGVLARYPFQTDSEGFRNSKTRDPIFVAALGDSFTDAMTLPVDEVWTARLEALLKVPVQNYGTASFGPQQELYVLRDYALKHRPRISVVAYFAGNDLFNAASFEQYENSEGAALEEAPGWRIKRVIPRYQMLYTFSLARTTFGQFWDSQAQDMHADALPATDIPEAPSVLRASFDRGMFSVPVAGRNLQVALMPPYLQTLNFSERTLESHPGWKATRATYVKMKQACEAAGSNLVVMFIPFKSQVYLPLLRKSFAPADLESALRFYFRNDSTPVDLTVMEANRLAQNRLLSRFCQQAGVPFLDLTTALQREVEEGRSVYFSDDAHWNAAGHAVAARALAEFLGTRHLLGDPSGKDKRIQHDD